MGEQAEIKTLTHDVALEIRDLDAIITRDDIVVKEVSIKNLRPSYANTQVAVISLPVIEARKLLESGESKIRWVVCRIRKCFRCFEYGHIARACDNIED